MASRQIHVFYFGYIYHVERSYQHLKDSDGTEAGRALEVDSRSAGHNIPCALSNERVPCILKNWSSDAPQSYTNLLHILQPNLFNTIILILRLYIPNDSMFSDYWTNRLYKLFPIRTICCAHLPLLYNGQK
jgi:hypothetical protein